MDAPPSPGLPSLQLAGAPALLRDGRPLAVGSRKALVLALLLALEPGARRTWVAELLWPDQDPAAARRNLRRDLFRLRQAGLEAVDEPGDALRLGPVDLAWPGPEVVAPRWLDGVDESGDTELQAWVQRQRARLHRQWTERVGDAMAEAPPPAAKPVPAAPSGRVPFVGREAELSALAAALERGQPVLLDGSPGVGKTRLALEALGRRGGVLLLRCRPEDTAVPFASALRALQLLREAAPDVALPAWVRRTLAPLVPEWAPASGEADEAPLPRLRLAFHQALGLLADGQFGAWIVDDWQWADAASAALFERPDDAPAELPCVLVHRAGELPPATLALRRRWLDDGRATALRLGPLGEPEARALLQALGAGDEADALLALGAGQPIWLIEAWRHRASGAGARLPGTVHEGLLARTRALGGRVRQVLECACLGTDDATPELLATVAGLDALSVARALDHAVAAELLGADEQGHHRFTHDLVAQVLADSLSPARRRALHGQWAEALAARGEEPGRVARHLEQAGRGADAVPWRLRAAQVAARRHAWADAAASCEAVRQASSDPSARLQAALLAARAWRRLSDTPRAEAQLEAAMADAVALGPAAVIDLALERSELLADTGRADAALAALAQVEADPALQPAQRLRLLRERANALGFAGRQAEAQPLLAQVIDALPASAVLERHRLLSIAARNAYWAGALPEARRLIELRLPLSRSLGDDSAVASGLFRLGVLLREEGHVDRAEALLLESAELARQAGHVEVLRSTLATLVTVRLGQMRLAEAEALIDEARDAAPFWESIAVEDVFDERRYMLHVLRGEVDAAWAVCDRQLRRLGGVQHLHFELSVHAQAVWLGLACDDLARARRHWLAAQPLVQSAGESSLASRELAAAAVKLRQAEGDAAGALQAARAWLAEPAPRRVDEHHAVLCAGACAAVDTGDVAQAAQWLAEAGALAVIPRTRAGWLLARLAHAQADGEPLAAVQQAIRDWLDERSLPALPALEAARLRAALAS